MGGGDVLHEDPCTLMIKIFTTVIIFTVNMFIYLNYEGYYSCHGYTNMPEVFYSADIS
jgi:hypothetical protein